VAQTVHHLFQIASAYLKVGRLSDAAEILRQVCTLDADHVAARLMLAQLLDRLGDPAAAATLHEELAQTAPQGKVRADHLDHAATLYAEKLGQPKRAEHLLHQLVEEDPGHTAALGLLRGLYGNAPPSDPSQLLALIDARLDRGALSSSEQTALLREAATLTTAQEPERALAYWTRLLADTVDVDALEQAAALAQQLNRIPLAVRLHQQRLAHPTPEAPPQRQARLLALAQLLAPSKPEQAWPHLKAVLAHDPKHPTALRLWGQVQEARGNAVEACRIYQELFALDPDTATDLPLRIARLLDGPLERRQEALTWYLRAQDADPLNREALAGVLALVRGVRQRSGTTANLKVVRDRLDWLAHSHREGLAEQPWSVALIHQLAEIELARGRSARAATLARVLRTFGALEEGPLQTLADSTPTEGPERLLGRHTVMLSDEHVRSAILPPGAGGFRRRLFAIVWDAVAQVEPDALVSGVTRSDRIMERDGSPPACHVRRMAQVLGVYGVDLYLHPSDPEAVEPLFTPEPTLVVGRQVLADPSHTLHHFRVASALEALRDGKGLMQRPHAPAMLAVLDKALVSMMGGTLEVLPVFSNPARPTSVWLEQADEHLERWVGRRTRRELRAL
ncbi:MAG: tetratricopeptide repeat protein, partial [Myxococcota bacterium]